MIADGARRALSIVVRGALIVLGSFLIAAGMFAIATIVSRHEIRESREASSAPHVGTPVVYTSPDGYRHAALLIGTADGEHWNLAAWSSSGELFTRFGVVEGLAEVPNTWRPLR